MKKEKPILMSTSMVQAILEGRKTMTRRVMTPQPIVDKDSGYTYYKDHPYDIHSWLHGNIIEASKYGMPGDILWVRESWQLTGWDFEDGEMTIKYATGDIKTVDCYDPTEDSMWLLNQVEQLENKGIIKMDQSGDDEDQVSYSFTNKKQPWKPSIHMPRIACRILVEITNIRVERLWDISEEDIINEGLIKDRPVMLSAWGNLWAKINGKESWNANPWVWCISFKRIDK